MIVHNSVKLPKAKFRKKNFVSGKKKVKNTERHTGTSTRICVT